MSCKCECHISEVECCIKCSALFPPINQDIIIILDQLTHLQKEIYLIKDDKLFHFNHFDKKIKELEERINELENICPECKGTKIIYSVVGMSMPDDPGIATYEECKDCKEK